MTPRDALTELLARIGANGGAAVLIGARELGQWPAATVATMKAQKMLVPARPATSLVCPGCERECVMPVHVIPAQASASRAFVVCDKRDDINRVNVPIGQLEQRHASGRSVAELIAQLLDLRQPSGGASSAGRWEVGSFKGTRHSGHLVLLAGGELKLTLAGHSVALADALDVKSNRIVIDKQMLNRCVDNPVAGGGDTESARNRRERLQARVREEMAKGTRAFLKVVAAEEGISKSWLKQLVQVQVAQANTWSNLFPQSMEAVSKAVKTKR